MHIIFAIASKHANALREWKGKIINHPLVADKKTRLYHGQSIVLGEAKGRHDTLPFESGEQTLTDETMIVDGQPHHTSADGSLDAFLQQATGFYAAVAGNPATHRIHLVTDYLASHPLFYMQVDGACICCNHYKILSDFCAGNMDEEWLAHMLLKQYVDFERTFLSGIRRVPPGSVLSCGDGQIIEIRTYKDITPSGFPDYTPEESVNLLGEKLQNAIARAVSGYGDVGVELSAGIDSSTVLAYTADAVKRNGLHAFSHVNRVDSPVQLDERDDIESLVTYFPALNHHFIDSKSPAILKTLSDTIDYLGFVPNQFFEVFSQHLYQDARQNDIDLLLSGFGGDQGISYRSKMFYHQLFREKQWRKWLSEERANGSHSAIFTAKSMMYMYAEWLLPDLFAGYKQWQYKRDFNQHTVHQFIQPQWIKQYRLRERSVQASWEQSRYKKVYEAQIEKLVHPFVTQRLELGYLISGNMGFAYRYPLLDEELVKLFLAIPYQHKLQDGTNRYLIRELIRGKVPEHIYQKTNKHGAAVPTVFERIYNEADRLLAFVTYCERKQIGAEYFRFKGFKDALHSIKKSEGGLIAHYPRMVNFLTLLVYFAKKAGKNAFFE